MNDTEWRELELGSLDESFAVDGDYTDDSTVATVEQQASDAGSNEVVLTKFDLSSSEARSVIKTLQDALEQNDERNVVGYPVDLHHVDGGNDVISCPQCEEILSLEERPTCPECGAQLEVTVRVTANGDHGPLPPQ